MSTQKGRAPKRRKGPTPRNRSKLTSERGTDPRTASQRALHERRVDRPSGARNTEANARYTPKLKARGPFRPTWHKVVGVALIVAGLGLFVINDLAWFDIELIPGGHNELWAVLGISIAATSTWWFGWFDRTPKPS